MPVVAGLLFSLAPEKYTLDRSYLHATQKKIVSLS